jgi:hypothetical protein
VWKKKEARESCLKTLSNQYAGFPEPRHGC